jgi:hypothetical protein
VAVVNGVVQPIQQCIDAHVDICCKIMFEHMSMVDAVVCRRILDACVYLSVDSVSA